MIYYSILTVNDLKSLCKKYQPCHCARNVALLMKISYYPNISLEKSALKLDEIVADKDRLLPPDPNMTTGSGQGTTSMNVRTINKEIKRNRSLIGAGRFGVVYKSRFQGDGVAVKYYRPEFEDSFQNETSMFHKATINLKNDSIGGFKGNGFTYNNNIDI